jgi:two-component system NtrC family sensor kinase
MISLQARLKEVEILKNLHKEVPSVLGNEGELIQAFTSITINALDAMEDDGTLSFETGPDGHRVLIKISDTGCGIPSDLIHRIFDPFFTTKSERGGTGLGLAIAKKIIEENSGRIEVASEEGKGTSFTITLPV